MFSNNFKFVLDPSGLEYKILQRMVGIWTKFATDGNPNPKTISPVKWEPLAVKQPPFKCLNISDELEIIELPETNRMAFWDSMYETSNIIY